MKTITITGHDRPRLFADLLRSLVANDLAGWRVLIAVEPTEHADEFVRVARSVLVGVDHSVAVNATRLGIRNNPLALLRRAFAAGSDLNLYLEEDMLVSPDVTRLALWYQQHHQPHWLCANLIAGPCGSSALLSAPQWPEVVFEAQTFNALGFVARREEWPLIERAFLSGDGPVPRANSQLANWRTHWGWDWSVYALVAGETGHRTLQPALARATHTGRVGTNALPSFHDETFGGLETSTSRETDFRLVSHAELPHQLRSHVAAHAQLTRMRVESEELARRRQFRNRIRAWFQRRRRRLFQPRGGAVSGAAVGPGPQPQTEA